MSRRRQLRRRAAVETVTEIGKGTGTVITTVTRKESETVIETGRGMVDETATRIAVATGGNQVRRLLFARMRHTYQFCYFFVQIGRSGRGGGGRGGGGAGGDHWEPEERRNGDVSTLL